MKPARFEYVRPDTVEAALEVLARYGTDAAVLSGGQSLMPMLNLRMARPAVLVDINRIAGLDRIEAGGGGLTVGSRARHREVLRSPAVQSHAPLLPQALRQVAHAAIRNRGTLGGSLALADPAAELPACVVCLGAEIALASLRGERRVPAAGFFDGPYGTARAADELLLEVRIPSAGPGWRFSFAEVARRHGDFALAGLAFGASLANGRIAACRIAFCGVEAAPRRLPGTEACMLGAAPEDRAARAALRAALAGELEPMSSDDCPGAYRKHLAGALLDAALDRLAREEVECGRA